MPTGPDISESEEAEATYEPPAIAWEEPYEPVGFGVSCTQFEGNPGCLPGPLFA